MARSRAPRKIEDIDAFLERFEKEAVLAGREAAEAAEGASKKTFITNYPDTAAAGTPLREALRRSMLKQIVVSRPAEPGSAISEREEHFEIAKRALSHLKMRQLKEVAGKLGLAKGGRLEELLDRVVEEVNADREAIAQLVLDYEVEPAPDRSVVTRIYPLVRKPTQVSGLAETLRGYKHRYFKVGIARWLIINDLVEWEDGLRFAATFRSYTADVERTSTSESGAPAEDRYGVRASPHEAAAEVSVTTKRPFVRVESRRTIESRAALSALEYSSPLQPTYSLNFWTKAPSGPVYGWSDRTVFMLSLISTNFHSDNVRIANFTTAGFERAKAPATVVKPDEEGAEIVTRPDVQSVRFQGQHLLDSRPACELISKGQGLTDLSLIARWTQGEMSILVPVTIRLDSDHVLVMTGYGRHEPNDVQGLHRAIVEGIETAYVKREYETDALQALAAGIQDRAASDESTVRVTATEL